MRWRIAAFSLIIGSGAFLAQSSAFANHLADAISHTQQAIEQGKKGNTDALVVHAKAALKSATSVYASTVGSFSSREADAKAQINAHVKESLANLKAAISEGKKTHAEAATHQAEEALNHLEAAPH
jgi:hypothetical protein